MNRNLPLQIPEGSLPVQLSLKEAELLKFAEKNGFFCYIIDYDQQVHAYAPAEVIRYAKKIANIKLVDIHEPEIYALFYGKPAGFLSAIMNYKPIYEIASELCNREARDTGISMSYNIIMTMDQEVKAYYYSKGIDPQQFVIAKAQEEAQRAAMMQQAPYMFQQPNVPFRPVQPVPPQPMVQQSPQQQPQQTVTVYDPMLDVELPKASIRRNGVTVEANKEEPKQATTTIPDLGRLNTTDQHKVDKDKELTVESLLDKVTEQLSQSTVDAPVHEMFKSDEPIDFGFSRFGKEKLEELEEPNHYDLVDYCIREALKSAPENVTFNTQKNPDGTVLLLMYENGYEFDRHIIDPYFYGGRGMPVFRAMMYRKDQGGNIQYLREVMVPCAQKEAFRRYLLAKFIGEPEHGVLEDFMIYQINHSMYIDPATYAMVDTSLYPLPDDIMNYKNFGEKVCAICRAYPFGLARYRLVDYENNDKFGLVSDSSVVPCMPDRQRTVVTTGVRINVEGNNLTIEEPNGNIRNIVLENY